MAVVPAGGRGGGGGRGCKRLMVLRLLGGAAALWAAGFLASGGHEELLSRSLLPLLLPPGPRGAEAGGEGAGGLQLPAGVEAGDEAFFALRPAGPPCAPRPPFVLVLVASAPGHARQRQAVRRSWGAARRAGGRPVRTLFVLGLPAEGEGDGAQLQAALEQEARRHGDLLQGRFADTYANLTRKTLALLGWAATRCPGAAFVVKADDDIFLNLPALARHLATLDGTGEGGPQPHYLGRVHWAVRPDRHPASRHQVPAALYPPDAFPPYCSGPAYVLSARAVAALLGVARLVPLVPVEDVFVGLCARRAGLAPRHLARMAGSARCPPDPCCYREVLYSVHGVAPSQMLDVWQRGRPGEAPCSAWQRALGILRCRVLTWFAADP